MRYLYSLSYLSASGDTSLAGRVGWDGEWGRGGRPEKLVSCTDLPKKSGEAHSRHWADSRCSPETSSYNSRRPSRGHLVWLIPWLQSGAFSFSALSNCLFISWCLALLSIYLGNIFHFPPRPFFISSNSSFLLVPSAATCLIACCSKFFTFMFSFLFSTQEAQLFQLY